MITVTMADLFNSAEPYWNWLMTLTELEEIGNLGNRYSGPLCIFLMSQNVAVIAADINEIILESQGISETYKTPQWMIDHMFEENKIPNFRQRKATKNICLKILENIGICIDPILWPPVL